MPAGREPRREGEEMDSVKPLERLLFGGIIHAGAKLEKRVDAVGIRDGRIAALGPRQDLLGLCGEQTLREDLGERCLLPGFLDPHNHFSVTTLAPLMADCRTPPLRTLAEIFEKMREKVKHTEAGRWVMGWGYEESLLKEGRDPVAAELDEACPDNPAVLMHASLHRCVVNSLAQQICGFDRQAPDPEGGRILRGRWGKPNGILVEQAAMKPFELARRDRLLIPQGDIEQLFAKNVNRLQRLGIVRVADAAVGPREKELYRRAAANGVAVPTDWMEVGDEGMFSPPTEMIRSRTGEAAVVKLFLDGAGQCALEFSLWGGMEGVVRVLGKVWSKKLPMSGLSALRKAEVNLESKGTLRFGFFLNDPDRIEGLVNEAHRQGLPVAAHALGNRAVRVMLDIYERAGNRYGAPAIPFRLEHAVFLTQDLIDRMARLQVAAVVQPAFLFQYGPLFRSLPLPGQIRILPLRRMLDAGVLVAGSSDGPCAPEDPLLAMDCAVRRTVPDNERLGEDEAIRVEEAIQLYTMNAARVMGCERDLGSIELGKRADLVVVSADPFQKSFVEIRVTQTLVNGATAWKTRRDALRARAGEERED